jgi:hypothetical protein
VQSRRPELRAPATSRSECRYSFASVRRTRCAAHRAHATAAARRRQTGSGNLRRRARHLHERRIFLSDFSVALLAELRILTGHTPWLFPHRKDSKLLAPVKDIGNAIAHRQADDDTPKKAIMRPINSSLLLPDGRWSLHDLRCTGVTYMQALGGRAHRDRAMLEPGVQLRATTLALLMTCARSPRRHERG